jgi:phage-related protein (TIGR01555 family)
MWLADTLKSLVSGLGTSKDKNVSLTYVFTPIDDEQLNAMHRSDWLARKIVDIIPNDMTREWREWQATNDQIEAIEALEKKPEINLQPKLTMALQKARLLGGAAIYMGMKDGAPDKELLIESVGKDALLYLHVLDRHSVTAGPIIKDVRSPWYGEPEYYQVNGGTGAMVQVHPSRMVRFIGAPVLDDRYSAGYEAWGDSILQVVGDAILNAGSAQAHIAALIPEAKSDVIYIPGLSKHLATTAGTTAITSRFTYANQMKSLFNMLLLEGNGGSGDNALGEKWEQKQINFAQLPELMQKYLEIASGAADIPVSRLLMQAPSGLGSNGDTALKNYYDNITARQRTELSPRLQRLDEVIIRSALGDRDPSIYSRWAPLYTLSEKEKAETFKMKADAARAIAGTGTSPPLMPIDALSDALVNELVEDGSLSGLEAAIEEYGKLSEQEEDEADVTAALGVPANANDPAAQQRERLAANDAAPRTLYVSRKVTNAASIIAWAKSQGFERTLPAEDMHVTIVNSRTPVDWMKVGESWSPELKIAAGGPRLMEQFGEATVLLFAANELRWRHEAATEAGASFDFDEYQPHITISYGFKGDLSKVEPYQGEIVLGPELFAEVKEDWAEELSEK